MATRHPHKPEKASQRARSACSCSQAQRLHSSAANTQPLHCHGRAPAPHRIACTRHILLRASGPADLAWSQPQALPQAGLAVRARFWRAGRAPTITAFGELWALGGHSPTVMPKPNL